MTIISLMLALLAPIQSYKWRLPIQTPQTCLSAHIARMAACATQFPDSTSIGRAVCEADSAGRYTACMGGIP